MTRRARSRSCRPLLCLMGAIWLTLGGPAAHAAEPRAVRSLLEIRQDRVVVQNWDLSCGAAALATVLNHQHGDPVSEREVAIGLIGREEYLADPELVQRRQGFSLLDLNRYAERRGYQGIGYGGLALDHLLGLAPAIVPVSLNGYDHFVVFRGRQGDRVLLADPAWGNRTMRVERFERGWIDYPQFGKVAFVVARRDGAAPPNRLAPRLREFLFLR